MSRPKHLLCVRGRTAELCAHRQLLQAWLSAQRETSVLWMKRHNETFCHRRFRETGKDVLYTLSAVWGILSAWKERQPFENEAKSLSAWEPALLLWSPLKHSVVAHPKHLHQRGRRWLAACVCVMCDYECVLAGMERGVLSVLSHTKKIKVLMARASSNGTLSCVCVWHMHVWVHTPTKLHSKRLLFIAALRHSGPVFLSLSIYGSLPLYVHVGMYPHAPTVSDLPHVWWFSSVSLPCTSSHIYHITLLWTWTHAHISVDALKCLTP